MPTSQTTRRERREPRDSDCIAKMAALSVESCSLVHLKHIQGQPAMRLMVSLYSGVCETA